MKYRIKESRFRFGIYYRIQMKVWWSWIDTHLYFDNINSAKQKLERLTEMPKIKYYYE